MTYGRSARFSAAAAMILFSLAFSIPSHGIDAPGIKTMSPPAQTTTSPYQVQPAPKAGPAGIGSTGASECILTSVSPVAAEVGNEIVLTGQGLSGSCSVYFQNASGGAYAAGSQTISPTQMKVIVPVLASGMGTISVRPRNSALPAGIQAAMGAKPFEVKPTVPVLQSVSHAPATTGEQINVYGSNFKQGEPYGAWFVSSTGKRVPAPPLTWLTATSFRVTVPDLEQNFGYQDGAQYPDTFFVTRGSTPSNRLPLKVLPAPRCLLKTVTPVAEYATGFVTLNGSYMLPECDVLFHSSTGQVFPATSKHIRDYGLSVMIPDMPGGKGYISAKPAGTAATGVKLPFEVKALTPLLAVRADQMDIGGFGQKIMPAGPQGVKIYKSNITKPNVPPFECQASYEVYRNGSVYTYVYSFKIEEFAVTQRYLKWMGINWPDRNDGALKYGVILSKSGMNSYEANYVKGEIRPGDWFLIGGGGKKSFCVYIQSKRPPAQGKTVQIDDFQSWPIFIYDFMAPQ
ncbi:MAG: IPT/TIG domain-containing protein [Thermodesulfobacteriota bacterium]